MLGVTPDADPDFHVTLHDTGPYVMQFSGGHTFAAGDEAFWIPEGTACPASAPSGTGGVLDASLQMTVTLSRGTYDLCLKQSGVMALHTHVAEIGRAHV